MLRIEVRRIIVGGMMVLVATLSVKVADAAAAIPANAYPVFLEGSIFDEAADDGRSNVPPSYIHKKVTFYMHQFTTRERVAFQKWLDRAGPFTPLMREIFREEGLPEDLVLLPLIESGFRVDARSSMKAMGLWQFMSATGTLYGLKVDKWGDERKDPVKSTRAAARHLKDLYNTFGTWPLALASYNAGSGKVKWALATTGSSDFWELGRSHALKPETRNYVPKFMAALIIAKNPAAFGFTWSEGPVIRYDTLKVPRGMEQASLPRIAGSDFRSLKGPDLRLKGKILPFDRSYYPVRLPKGKVTSAKLL